MDWSQLQDVIIICVPVFAIIALGKILEHRGVLNKEHRDFANWLIYYFALPALILSEVARQSFFSLINIPLILAPVAAIALLCVVFSLLAKCFNVKGSLTAAFIFGTFWANVSYMGFPLAQNAFAEKGLALAAVYNAFIIPVMVALGFILIGIYSGSGTDSLRQRIQKIFLNPVILAAFAGIIIALAGELFRDSTGTLQMPSALNTLLQTIGSFLRLIGGMGLPLALLAIGGSMHLSEIRRRLTVISVVLTGKLIIFPLFTLLIINVFFQQASTTTAAIAVLLSATPNAVASYVVSRQVGIEEGFVSSLLVLSTALSVITIPVWLYIIL